MYFCEEISDISQNYSQLCQVCVSARIEHPHSITKKSSSRKLIKQGMTGLETVSILNSLRVAKKKLCYLPSYLLAFLKAINLRIVKENVVEFCLDVVVGQNKQYYWECFSWKSRQTDSTWIWPLTLYWKWKRNESVFLCFWKEKFVGAIRYQVDKFKLIPVLSDREREREREREKERERERERERDQLDSSESSVWLWEGFKSLEWSASDLCLLSHQSFYTCKHWVAYEIFWILIHCTFLGSFLESSMWVMQ